ncbi:monovalent cation/H(+) antiporter subunit G [Methanoculleus sp. FWC-SCC3]|uniref:Monovalent cation/H(+) antiporter subunit G n=1 Tax=Methanoculleus methanifontis TaxID=2584086 RepID=A0ABT8M5E9_9EURY|nr:monovalent cation/H(+) antiporter subunit G [Methanoculleus sp. FWC-SCC3]MDN7013787.1 monovalent cation/H(+) antiporter subunit G [Methanoculleus sp. FWC-SCC3]
MRLLNSLALIFIVIGLFFMVVGAVGLVRLPDFYTRAHASGKCDTLGEGMMLVGFILYEGPGLVAVKLLLLVIFIYITSPTAVHALVHFARARGIEPWKKGDARR